MVASNWKTISSEEVYKTPWIRVRRDEVESHVGKRLTYSVVEIHHPSVFIVATNEHDEIYLQKNYRYTINQTIWELPAGHSDGEKPLVAAKRELLEEAGLKSDNWTDLGQVYQAVGVANFPLNICLARNVSHSIELPEETEHIIEHRFFSMREIEHMITRGEIVNVTDMGAIFMARLQLQA